MEGRFVNTSEIEVRPLRKPPWLKRKLFHGANYTEVRGLLKKGRLHTVCQEAHCPNLGECFSRKTATFLILGDRCTRHCHFCAVKHAQPNPLDRQEPERVAKTAQKLGLRYIVITSVTRDDVADGGASVFAETITHVRKRIPNVMVEVLIPDFQGKREALDTVLRARPEVLNHNIETVPSLYPVVRPQADYHRSMDLLRYASRWDETVTIKSGLMLGLGESYDQVQQTLGDLRNTGCQFLTLGQYLQPSKKHLPVIRYVPPEEFDQWRHVALDMGFLGVASGPFVRSSYQARNLYEKNR